MGTLQVGAANSVLQQKIDTSTGVQKGGVNYSDAGTSATFGAVFGGLFEGVVPSANIMGVSAGA